MLLLHLSQHTPPCIAQPLHLTQAGLSQIRNGCFGNLGLHLLVRSPCRIIHAALFLRLELRPHFIDGFLLANLRLRREHAVEHATHLRGEHGQVFPKLAAVDFVDFVADRLVDLQNECPQTVEDGLQLLRRCLAFVEVDFAVVGQRLLQRRALLVD